MVTAAIRQRIANTRREEAGAILVASGLFFFCVAHAREDPTHRRHAPLGDVRSEAERW